MAQLKQNTVNGHYISMVNHGYGSETGLLEVGINRGNDWVVEGWLTRDEANEIFTKFEHQAHTNTVDWNN